MEPYELKLESWTLNNVFNRIKNSRVVQPPYEKAWYYSNKFFLDKRYWLNDFATIPWDIVDDYKINWITYLLVHNYTYNLWYVYSLNWTTATNITPWWFFISSNSPKRFAIGKWLIWPRNSTWRTVDLPVSWETDWTEFDWTLIPSYAGWYIKFKYTWVQNVAVWDYIVFKDWALLWAVNRVEYIDSDYIFIIATNIRWTIPRQWTVFDLYKQADWVIEWPVLLAGYTNWVNLIITDWENPSVFFPVLLTKKEVIDIVNFDWNIWALTSNKLFFSRTTYEDNTNFYPTDSYWVTDWFKLFSLWKVLLLFAWINKLYVPTTSTTDKTLIYAWYDVNYQWELYSKYSCIFADQTIYVLQKDKQLKQIDIIQYNTTSYDLKVSDVLTQTKWLFNILEDWWEVYINSNQRFLNFLYYKNNKTINFQYDKMYQHFIENDYNVKIYKFWELILSTGKILKESLYTDNWVEYEQEINFILDTTHYIYKPYIIRTMFWLVENLFNVKLDIEFEIWWIIKKLNKVLSSFDFDNRLSETLTGDEVIWWDKVPNEQIEYNGNIVSIQSTILYTGRFIRFKYSGTNRFMIWDSFILTDRTKLFINEPLLTN